MTFRSPRCEPQREEEINPGQETQERLGGHLNLLDLGLHFMYRFCCLLVCSTRKCTEAHIFQMYTLPAGCTPSYHVHSVNRLLQNEGLGSPWALTQVVIVSLQFLPVINRFFLMSVSDLLHSRVRLSFPTTAFVQAFVLNIPHLSATLGSAPALSQVPPLHYRVSPCYLSLFPIPPPSMTYFITTAHQSKCREHSSLSSVFTTVYVLCLAQHRQQIFVI